MCYWKCGSPDAQQLTCFTLLQAWLSKGWRSEHRPCDSCHPLLPCGMVILSSLWENLQRLTGAGSRLRCAESVWQCGAEGALVLCVAMLLASRGQVDKICVSVPLFLLCKTVLILDSALWSSNEKCSLMFE